MFKATKLIAEKFEDADIKYQMKEVENASYIEAKFRIDNGPLVIARYISRDESNAVAVRVYELIGKISPEKKDKIVQTANECNNSYRYFKFIVDESNDLNVEYDFPVSISDESVGMVAAECFIHLMHILDHSYAKFMQALWS